MSSIKLKLRLRALAYKGFKMARKGNPFWSQRDAWSFVAQAVVD